MTTPLTDLLWQAEKRTGLQGGKDISSAIHTARDHVADRPTAP